jgi:cell division protein FtsQ
MMPRSIADKTPKTKDVPLRWRIAARSSAVMFLALALLSGLSNSGQLDYAGSPFPRMAGKVSGVVGLAADDIQITGLEHHEPEEILRLIGVAAGGSLVQFDAAKAKATLEAQNWISSASVQRKFPNQLEIFVAERRPFAIWQQGNKHYVIDQNGVAMSGLDPAGLRVLPMVTGEGANLLATQIINQVEAYPALMSRLQAAARVGNRRWTLYLDNGVKVSLPEEGVAEALQVLDKIETAEQLLSKGIREVDLRVAGRMRIAIAEVKAEPKQN